MKDIKAKFYDFGKLIKFRFKTLKNTPEEKVFLRDDPPPWKDFSKLFLRNTLSMKWLKYMETGNKDHLIDVALFAMFLYYNKEAI